MKDIRHNAEEHRHASTMFDTELHELEGRVLTMGQLVDVQVAAAVNAFVARDQAAATRFSFGA